jgi:hypothetical protein
LGDRLGEAGTLGNLGLVVGHHGDLTRALALHEEALALSRELGDRRGIAIGLSNLANLARERGDQIEAATHLRECLLVRSELGDQVGVIVSLEGIAAVAVAQGQPEPATRLYAVATAWREAMSAPLAPNDQEQYERDLAAVRGELGEDAFDAAWDAGWALSPEEAVTEALAVADELGAPTTG